MWAKRSPSFPGRILAQFKVGPGTVAFDYHARGVLDAVARTVPASAWFGTVVQLSVDSSMPRLSPSLDGAACSRCSVRTKREHELNRIVQIAI